MEQRLAEFRAARKRAGLAAEPSTSCARAQTSGEKAEAATTPKAAPGWLKRFLAWKPRPASIQVQPCLAQVRGRPCPGDLASGTLSWPPRKLRPRPRPLPAHRVVALGHAPAEERATPPPLVSTFGGRTGVLMPPTCCGFGLGVSGHSCQH